MVLLMGIRIGQKSQPTGLCVIEASGRDVDGSWEVHYTVRFLDQLDSGLPFPDVAVRVGEILSNVKTQTGKVPQIYIDATGLGPPIVDLMEEKLRQRLTPVYFNHGDQRREEEGADRWTQTIKLGKAFLVSRLQLLLQTNRLHLPRNPSAVKLAKDLLEYEIRPDERASERYGAFRVGSHDDLVTALGLALQEDVWVSRPLEEHERQSLEEWLHSEPSSLNAELSHIWR